MALVATIYFGIYHQFDQIAQVVIAYLAIQASVDAFSTYQASKETQELE